MPITLGLNAIEESTYIITITFRDEDGNAVVPNELTWSLTNESGVAINSRTDVAIATPAASVDVVLSGDDLTQTPAGTFLVFTIEGTYDSDAGANLPLKDQAKFHVDNLIAV